MRKTATFLAAFMVTLGACYGASEIVANLVLKVTKGGVIYINEAANQSITLSATVPNVSQFTASIPTNTVGTALVLGSVLTNGFAWVQNCDPSNFVDIGVQDGGVFYPLIRLKALEANVVRFAPGVAPYARANIAPVVLKSPIVDN